MSIRDFLISENCLDFLEFLVKPWVSFNAVRVLSYAGL